VQTLSTQHAANSGSTVGQVIVLHATGPIGVQPDAVQSAGSTSSPSPTDPYHLYLLLKDVRALLA
jgi:hypothetical protein